MEQCWPAIVCIVYQQKRVRFICILFYNIYVCVCVIPTPMCAATTVRSNAIVFFFSFLNVFAQLQLLQLDALCVAAAVVPIYVSSKLRFGA